MTLTQMVDVWSTMTPKQRELVYHMAEATADHFHLSPDMSLTMGLQHSLDHGLSDADKKMWNGLDWPFKFGEKVNG